jgi:hypothetical protein
MGGDISRFKIPGSAGVESIEDIRRRQDLPDEVVLVDSWPNYPFGGALFGAHFPLIFPVRTEFHPVLAGPGPRDVWPPLSPAHPDGQARLERTMAGVLISAIAASWGVDVNLVLQASRFNSETGRFDQDKDDPIFAFLAPEAKTGVGEQIFAIRKP